ncbi:MAG TPA: hypothetical protein VHX44_18640 [Planctomycetota bacterium]|nr:hypothetical protein [Planctomycetota bacterium]
MSATFACSHCGATYSRKPVLVGRAVRCTTCKNAFRLREDGIADRIEMADPAPAAPAQPLAPPQPVTPPPAAIPTPAPVEKPSAAVKPPAPKLASKGWGLDLDVEVVEPKSSAPAPAPAKPAASAPPAAAIKSPLPKDAPGATRKSERMTAQQMEARRAMSATLAGSMTEALKSEAVKREEQTDKKKAKAEGRVGQIGPAVLTGQGVEEARSSRLILLGSIVALLVGAGLWWLLFTDSPERAGLSAYTAEVDPARIRAGERVLAIQQRAWLVGLPPAYVGTPPLIDVHDARIGTSRAIKLAAAKDAIVALKGLVPVEPGPVWIPPDRLGAVEDLRRPDQKPEAFVSATLKREKKAISNAAFLESLVKTGMTQADAEVVDLFIRGRTNADGSNDIAKR